MKPGARSTVFSQPTRALRYLIFRVHFSRFPPEINTTNWRLTNNIRGCKQFDEVFQVGRQLRTGCWFFYSMHRDVISNISHFCLSGGYVHHFARTLFKVDWSRARKWGRDLCRFLFFFYFNAHRWQTVNYIIEPLKYRRCARCIPMWRLNVLNHTHTQRTNDVAIHKWTK